MNVRLKFRCVALLSAALMLASVAEAGKKGAITKLSVDPDAPVVGLFKGMEDGKLSTTLIQKDSKSGNLLVENLTKEAITVEMPDSFVGVHVLNQFGGGLGGGGLGGGGLGGGGLGGGGGGQTTGGGGGGGLGGGGLGGGGGGLGGGGGFFSIPPEKIVRLPVKSVCLEHGKPEPSPRMKYRVFPVEYVSKDPVLKELLNLVATGRINEKVAQAAAWNIANKKSWQELAAMRFRRLGSLPDTPHFSHLELTYAQNLVAVSRQKAAEKKDAKPAEPAEPVRRDRTGRVVSQR